MSYALHLMCPHCHHILSVPDWSNDLGTRAHYTCPPDEGGCGKDVSARLPEGTPSSTEDVVVLGEILPTQDIIFFGRNDDGC